MVVAISRCEGAIASEGEDIVYGVGSLKRIIPGAIRKQIASKLSRRRVSSGEGLQIDYETCRLWPTANTAARAATAERTCKRWAE
jgi:hypothetical protein